MTPYFVHNSPLKQTEVSRLLTAAVISKRFRTLLLTNPAYAIDRGFQGEPFQLENEEKNRILSIRAGSLAEFARQLTVEFDYTLPVTRAFRRL